MIALTALAFKLVDTLRRLYELAFDLFEILNLLYALFTHSPYMTVGLMLLIAAVALSIIRGLIRIAVYVAIFGSIGLFILGLINFLF